MRIEKKIANLQKMEYTGEHPRLMQAKTAYALSEQGQTGRYFSVQYWGEFPVGFTRFEFSVSGFHGNWIPIASMNRQDTAIDILGFINPGEWIIVYGLDLPESDGIYRLKNHQMRESDGLPTEV